MQFISLSAENDCRPRDAIEKKPMESRNCPTCKTALKHVEANKRVLDACDTCGGTFYDAGELDAIVELLTNAHNLDIGEPDIPTVPEHEHAREVACPADGTAMEAREVAGEIIDVCEKCGGVWLDDGEAAALMRTEMHILRNLNLYYRLGN